MSSVQYRARWEFRNRLTKKIDSTWTEGFTSIENIDEWEAKFGPTVDEFKVVEIQIRPVGEWGPVVPNGEVMRLLDALAEYAQQDEDTVVELTGDRDARTESGL